MKVRTRFSPSPTGYLHVGGIRTALFAWLVARQKNGDFILRIEDTDKAREVKESFQHIIKALSWLGLNWDEGPQKGGEYAPYKQSERLEIYKKWAEKLIESGKAYSDPYTQKEVQAFREQARKDKKPFLYRNHRPKNPPKWDGSKPLRFKSDPKHYQWHDIVMGDLSTGPEVIDDFILIKSDGYPTYNFAHIIDDTEMNISHVIRGQEFLSSMPNYLNLYEALGLDHPVFATVPHIMAPEGNRKLSKRDGAKDILDYASEGYLPEAIISFLATMGWNDGTEQEVFTIDELIEKFSLERVQRSGARFDERRLLWANGHFIRSKNINELYKLCEGYWPNSAENHNTGYKQKVLSIVQERLKFFKELPNLTEFFFARPAFKASLIEQDKKLRKVASDKVVELLKASIDSLEESDFSLDELTEKLNSLLDTTNEKPVLLFSLIRLCVTRWPFSPPLAETLETLGKKESLERLKEACDKINKVKEK